MLSRACGILLLSLLVMGCAPIVERRGSPLAKPCMSADSVVLEIYSARFPFNDPKYNEALWRQIDEQPIPPELRRALGEYGLRAGILQGQLPAELQELLNPPVEGAASSTPPEKSPSQSLEQVVVDLEAELPVSRRVLQLRAAKRAEIQTSGVYESLPLLESGAGGLRGRPYPRGQGLLSLKSYPQPDGRVRLDLLPELHYGDPRVNIVGHQGVVRLQPGRSKKVFDHLAVSATLSPGEMLAIASLPNRPGSLGHYFFTEPTAGALNQKLLLIRLAQTQHNDLFGADMVLSDEE
jgi:hypothetical protein